ncbi:hypothetical protein EH165_04920 [Nakamurella antarctica]|uniref:PRC-barrel domain-containing protein n=1 Tax=Nakamurella antarctica TaxID=1902245 RepID=A0A3G8ZK00_9ACTN|nr:PRC-barrel domain-containing protein [Nakamurella antarctica]AZI57593.1 hypothetical protein EH165_04920 [Nakamurella antarctica]
MRFSEGKGHKVVSTGNAETVGKVAAFVVDPQTATVAALTLAKTGELGTSLAWPNITGFGPDAVTVAGASALQIADERIAYLADKSRELVKKQVLTQAGRRLGVVQDVDFHPGTGQIATLLLDTGEIEGNRLAGIGSYAVIVRS